MDAVYPLTMMSSFFQSQQIFDSVFEQLRSAFEETILAIAAQGKRVLRVLEVGAGMRLSIFKRWRD